MKTESVFLYYCSETFVSTAIAFSAYNSLIHYRSCNMKFWNLIVLMLSTCSAMQNTLPHGAGPIRLLTRYEQSSRSLRRRTEHRPSLPFSKSAPSLLSPNPQDYQQEKQQRSQSASSLLGPNGGSTDPRPAKQRTASRDRSKTHSPWFRPSNFIPLAGTMVGLGIKYGPEWVSKMRGVQQSKEPPNPVPQYKTGSIPQYKTWGTLVKTADGRWVSLPFKPRTQRVNWKDFGQGHVSHSGIPIPTDPNKSQKGGRDKRVKVKASNV